jgi:hypothetical protein
MELTMRRPDILCIVLTDSLIRRWGEDRSGMIYDGTPRGKRWLDERFPVTPGIRWEWLFTRHKALALLRVASRDGLRVRLRRAARPASTRGRHGKHWHLIVADGICFPSTNLFLRLPLARVTKEWRHWQ